MRVEADTGSIDAALDDIADAVMRAGRPVAQVMAQIFYDEARILCPESAEEHVFYGRDSVKTGVTYKFQPGNLRDSIYQVFSKDKSVEGTATAGAFGPSRPGYSKATYHIAWNHRLAPYGFMVEFGTSRAAAHPFLAPAYDARVRDAIEAGKRELVNRVRADVPGFQ
jgi:hypothetical protein